MTGYLIEASMARVNFAREGGNDVGNQDMAEMKLMMKNMLEGQQIQGAKIDGLVKRMDSMEGKMGSMQEEIASIREDMATKDDLAALEARMDAKIDLKFQAVREEMATKDDLAALETKMDANFKVVHEKIDHLTQVSEYHTLKVAQHDQDIYLLKHRT
jgi:hypothetical protein